MKYLEIAASSREAVGTGNSRKIRREEGLVPAVLYGARKNTESISLSHNDILKILRDDAVFTTVIILKFPSGYKEVILKDIQYHPFKNKVLHVDFMRVDRKEKINVHIPIDFIGLDISPGKKSGGIYTKHITAVEIKCLPEDLIECIEVDASKMELDDSIHISEIPLTDKIELVKKPTEHDDPAILSIHIPKPEKDEKEETESQ